jgi:chemotaxis protein MotB
MGCTSRERPVVCVRQYQFERWIIEHRRLAMGVRGKAGRLMVGAMIVAVLGGCVSMAEHDRLRARNRTLAAEKESLAQGMYDNRTTNESLSQRVGLCERELATKGELVANLQKENELLEGVRKMCQTELERMGQKQLGDITITGPKLPEPLNNAIKAFAKQQPDLVVFDEARGTVKWKSDLLFALGSDTVKDASLDALHRFTEVLNSPVASGFEAVVVGHTDNRPIVRPETKARFPTNWHLSAARAIAVASALQHYGYPPERIGVMGYGPYRPVADNGSEAGAAQNRRVEVYLIPRGSLVSTGKEASAAAPHETSVSASESTP